MNFINKYFALPAIILSTVVNTACTSIKKEYVLSGQVISVERKSTNKAYVDQLELKEVNGETSISGQVIWHTSMRGPSEGNFYFDLVDSDGKTIKTIVKGFSRSVVNKRQSAFTQDLGVLPSSVTKLVVSYGK